MFGRGFVWMHSTRQRRAFAGFLIPLFLVTMFELNYEVHKVCFGSRHGFGGCFQLPHPPQERSANFFGCITFDDGKRAKNTFTSQFIRYSIWLLSFALVILGIIGAAKFIVTPADYVETSRYSNGALERADADGSGVSSLTGTSVHFSPPITQCSSWRAHLQHTETTNPLLCRIAGLCAAHHAGGICIVLWSFLVAIRHDDLSGCAGQL